MSDLNKINNIPCHLAVIMDGNGRWAKKRILNRVDGHRKGIEAARTIVRASRELGIKYLTLYTFSKENWNRPKMEVDILMSLLENHLKSERELFIENNIRFTIIGNRNDLPENVLGAVAELEEATKANDAMTLQLALSYGGRDEIVEAAKKVASMVKSGELNEEDITEEIFAENLFTKGVPDPDLLIRTSGESRISNFLLWQSAYTEIYITDVLWPDFTRDDLCAAISDFQKRERRFGLVADDGSSDAKRVAAGT